MEGKDIYILLVHALLRWRRPARPRGRRPACPVDDALLAPWTTPCSPRGRRPARPVDDAQLVTPCWADTGTRPIFQHSRWTNDGDKMLRRKEILPGHIFSLPKKEEIEKS
jgi:hypothetical protein